MEKNKTLFTQSILDYQKNLLIMKHFNMKNILKQNNLSDHLDIPVLKIILE